MSWYLSYTRLAYDVFWAICDTWSLQSDQYEELMQESEEVKVRRDETSEMLQVSNASVQ